MRKYVIWSVGLVAFAGIAYGAYFYWYNLRGIWPAIQAPPYRINEEINTTGLPLNIPDGFSISIYADSQGLDRPRVLKLDPEQTLLVSSYDGGEILALPDQNQDGIADDATVLLSGLNRPHGIETICRKFEKYCELYIAQEDQITRYEYNAKLIQASNPEKLIDLPSGGRHKTRTLLLDPTELDRLLVSIGSSCDTCFEEDMLRGSIQSVNLETGETSVFASGLRNSVFMTVKPDTQKVWVTEMGRDFLGDDLPPDEINIIESAYDYGWPVCYGQNIYDSQFGEQERPDNYCDQLRKRPSHIDIPAHSAPLGLAFVPKSSNWPPEYHGDLLVAYHGSWNRTVPTGYKIVRFELDENERVENVEDFISGWLTDDNRALGRPVDLLFTEQGELFISDDKANVIYRVMYQVT